MTMSTKKMMTLSFNRSSKFTHHVTVSMTTAERFQLRQTFAPANRV
jgi:hypothetical protein